jgi:hypothetical protein
MNPWIVAVLIAAMLVLGSALYIRLRWHRAPQAYRAMVGVAACYLLIGSLLGAWVLHIATPKHAVVTVPAIPNIPASAVAAGNDPNKFSAKVVGITDGDTVDALDAGGLIPTPFASRESTRPSMTSPSERNRLSTSSL